MTQLRPRTIVFEGSDLGQSLSLSSDVLGNLSQIMAFWSLIIR